MLKKPMVVTKNMSVKLTFSLNWQQYEKDTSLCFSASNYLRFLVCI